ncbi:proteasome component pup2 [Pestalotiopsis sp. IQ-011]
MATSSSVPSLVFLIGFIAAVIYFASSLVYNVFLHPLRRFPGPLFEAASRLPYAWGKLHGRATHRSKDLHDRYGHVVRIAPDILSFTASQAWLDLLSNLLKQKEHGHISDGEIRETAAAFIVAGSETTATLLSASLYLLCRNPTILQKTIGKIRSDFSSASDLTYSKLQSHEYLNAVLLESLRLYPPAPDSLFRRTKSAAVVVGEVIPPDTCLTVNLWAANRSPKNFHRPDDFVPERWLKDTSPEFFDDDRAVAKPFSFGPRDCLGKV